MEFLQSKGKQFTKIAQDFTLHLIEGEKVHASVQIGLGNYLLTQFRLVSLNLTGGIKASYPLAELESFRTEPGKLGVNFYITPRGKSEIKLGALPPEIESDFPDLLSRLMDSAEASSDLRSESLDFASERYANIPTNRKKSSLPKHLVKSIMKNSKANEDPLMIITGQVDSTDGSLIVYSDRCVISKSGIIGGFMSGSLGGSRDAVFYFRDITGIEYNSGMFTGVLEILTASYEGSGNKDFWTGFLNANKNLGINDPRTLSNTLPLMKDDYASAKPLIDKLRTMIQEAKETKVIVNTTVAQSAPSTADELQKLAELLDKGLLTPDEFKVAKNKLLGIG